MQRNLSIEIPHGFSQAEAQDRVRQAIATLSAQYKDKIGALETTWQGNRLTGKLGALGQTIEGGVDVNEGAVHVELHLPLLLVPFSGKIDQFVRGKGARFLGVA